MFAKLSLFGFKRNARARLFSKTRSKSDDPFVFIKDIFVDGGYNKVAKIINLVCIVLHTFSFCFLEMNYFFHHFTTDLLIKYGFVIAIVLYIIICMYFSHYYEKSALDLTKGILSLFWPLDFCGLKIKEEIFKNAKKVNKMYYTVLMMFGLALFSMSPVWGSTRDWVLCIQVYEYYFGKWWIIPFLIYASTAPWLGFSAIRLNFMIIYAIVQLRMQVYLINQQIAEISIVHEDVRKIDDLQYQNKIFQKLRLCISHHVMLKRWLKKLLSLVKVAMPLYVVLGIISCISVLFYVVYCFENVNLIGKIRIFCVACCASFIVYLFSDAGQSLTNETSGILDILGTCPWYDWDIKNRKILLVFMANSMEPMSFSMAGVTVDYRFALGAERRSRVLLTVRFILSEAVNKLLCNKIPKRISKAIR